MSQYSSNSSLTELDLSEIGLTDDNLSSSPTSPYESDSDSILSCEDGKKVVLVTGGAGFIGSAVAEALLSRGDDVVIVDEINDYYDTSIKRMNLFNLIEKYGEERCKVYEGDICDVPFIEKVFKNEEPRWICHMAARAGVRPSIQDPFIYIHSNIEGTTRLFELAHKYHCKSFAFASSSSVYGGSSKNLFSEKDVVDFPVSPYAASKKSCELIAYTYHHLYKLNISGLRFFTVYGPRGRPDMAPYKFIKAVCNDSEIQQYGDGSTSRDYTYISDIVDGVIRSLDRPLGYQIYNLGRGEPTHLSHFINLVEKNVGKKANIRICPEQPGDVPRTCADISKARKLLGYDPKVSFEEGISLTVQWYKKEIMSN
mmetsp:Transcript_2709/g.4052  ORF Transcript_2709/g.4052 Transcript_2709/m.4052 type:complete len:369 (+) Transcript_2709:180-1286(+)